MVLPGFAVRLAAVGGCAQSKVWKTYSRGLFSFTVPCAPAPVSPVHSVSRVSFILLSGSHPPSLRAESRMSMDWLPLCQSCVLRFPIGS